MYNETLDYIAERQKSGNLFVICPEADLQIGHIEKNPEKLKEVYEVGRKTAEKNLEQVKAFLECD